MKILKFNSYYLVLIHEHYKCGAGLAVSCITESIFHCGFVAGNVAAQHLGVSSHLVSRITGTIYIVQGDKNASMESCSKVNVGLNLKFNKRNEEVRSLNSLSNVFIGN
jgi:hypothetical protein